MEIKKGKRIGLTVIVLIAFLLMPATAFGQEKAYEFDVNEFEKKTFSLDGYVELRPAYSCLNQDSSFYRIRYFDLNRRKTFPEVNFALLADLSYRKGFFEVLLEPYLDYTLSPYESEAGLNLYQGYVALKPSSSLAFMAGKRTLRWGKGYAWNPVALVERRKNPNEPDLAREGYFMVTAEYTKSFPGILKTLSISPIIIPVTRSINPAFSRESGLNFAGKIYFLFLNTDIDLMFLAGESQPARLGLDFSRNIRSNLELHGEVTFLNGLERKMVMENGEIVQESLNAIRYLLGLRYLSRTETTYILEYYHNGAGYDSVEMNNFYSAADLAYEQYLLAGVDTGLRDLAVLESYGEFSPMTDYLYFRIMQKDIFGILYLNPSAMVIANISDGSASISPEFSYTGFTNLELRLKAIILLGEDRDEFGEKTNRFRLELRARYFF